jgi:hypothetical protein
LKCANESGVLGPEVALVVSAATSASNRMGLTGKSSAENIHICEFSTNGSDILVAPHSRPVRREHGPTEWINLNLPANLEPGALETQVESADAREETPHRHRFRRATT